MLKVVVFLALVAFASAGGLFKAPQQKKASATCPALTCLAVGAQCGGGTSPCQPCLDALINCTTAAAGNSTKACACVATARTCYNGVGATTCNAYISGNEQLCNTYSCTGCQTVTPVYAGSTCRFDNWCPPTSGNNPVYCTAQGTLGAACNGSLNPSTYQQCGDLSKGTLTCSATTNTCGYIPNTLVAGDYCSATADCIPPMQCTGGRCVGAAAGAACASTDVCAYGLYCSTQSKCTAKVAAGGACLGTEISGDDDAACSVLYACGTAGTCVKYFSVANGGACNEDEECGLGYFCKLNGATGTCAAVASALTACNSSNGDADCTTAFGDGSACTCDGYDNGNYYCDGNYGFVSSSCNAATFDTTAACYTANQCVEGQSIFDSRSCAQQKCSKDTLCLLSCLTFGLGSPLTQQYVAANCISYPSTFTCAGVNGGSSSSGSLIEVSFALIAMLLSVYFF